jgi:hypothetical protein
MEAVNVVSREVIIIDTSDLTIEKIEDTPMWHHHDKFGIIMINLVSL